jgi:hypothetical protein
VEPAGNLRAHLELAGEGAELVGGIGNERAKAGVPLAGSEGVKRFGDVAGEGVDADLELDDIGGRPRWRGRTAELAAQGLDGGADLGAFSGVSATFRPSISMESASTWPAICWKRWGEMGAISVRRK